MRHLQGRPVEPADVEAAYVDLACRRGPGRPYVFVNMVASADGAISVEGRTAALSTEADRFVFHYLRSVADVILVGAQTVRAERYGPPRISDERQTERKERGQDPVPRIAIVTGSLDLDWSSRLFAESPTRPIVLTTTDAPAERLADARRVADVVQAGERRVDLPAALVELGRQGIGSVLCEGGPTLNGVLAAGDLIDELCLTVSPVLVGGDVATGLLGHVRLPDLVPMSVVHVLEEDGDLFLRYRRKASASPPDDGAHAAIVAGTSSGDPGTLDAFHGVMSSVEHPMVIVTASDGTNRGGCLVGFSAQCSIDPARYVVCISKKNHTHRIARATDTLIVHFPAADQRSLAEHFGTLTGDEVDKFAGIAVHDGPGGAPVIDDVHRWFAGRVIEMLDSGDHVAFMLAPVDGQVGEWTGQLGFQAVKDLDAGHGA